MTDSRIKRNRPPRIRVAAAVSCALAAGAAVAALAGTRPDPAVQAQKDGCGRNAAGLFKKEQPTWAYVGDAATPAEGPPPPVPTATGVAGATPAWPRAHPTVVNDP